MPDAAPVSREELLALCAEDMNLYNRTFFPDTFRKKSPDYHRKAYELLERRRSRFAAMEIFRGGAKTTILRAYASRRIAYNISRTILFVSNAEDQSVSSIRWLKRQVEHNKPWASFYGLSKGRKWRDDFTEILHANGTTTTLLPKGITGQIRGINIEDWRPDLIIVDDIDTEETTATPAQRQKLADLLFGALMKSLASSQDAPNAKLVILQTPLNDEDQINTCMKDPTFDKLTVSCFDENGKSTWEDMFPTEDLQEDKEAHMARGQTSLWLREMECVLSARENTAFREEWLKYYEEIPEGLAVYMGIDPVPPPSETEIAAGLKHKDYEVLSVVGVKKGEFYLLELSSNRGHDPDWTITEFFRLLDKWNPIKVRLDAIAYQRTLKYILDKAMRERRRYVQINAVADKRKKRHKITQAFSGICSYGKFHIARHMSRFVSQFVSYPNIVNDDDLDATAMALDEAMSSAVDEYLLEEEETSYVPQSRYRNAP